MTITPAAITAPARPLRCNAGCVEAFHDEVPSVVSLPLKRTPRISAMRPGETLMLPSHTAGSVSPTPRRIRKAAPRAIRLVWAGFRFCGYNETVAMAAINIVARKSNRFLSMVNSDPDIGLIVSAGSWNSVPPNRDHRVENRHFFVKGKCYSNRLGVSFRRFMRKQVGLSVIIATLCGSIGFAQSVAGLGAISGTVHDASGSAVPAAQVVVDNESKGIHRTLDTTEAGVFAAPSLVPASGYTVNVNKQGFADYELKDIQITVGQNIGLDIVLQVASASTQVQVEAVAPIVDYTKTDVSQVVGSEQILELPINGRRVDSFVLMSPAVVPDGTFGLVSFRGIAGGNYFLTDGNDTTEQYYNENAGRTRIASQISQDAVQEFQVVSNNYSAEFGHATGGVVNTVTRSGSTISMAPGIGSSATRISTRKIPLPPSTRTKPATSSASARAASS